MRLDRRLLDGQDAGDLGVAAPCRRPVDEGPPALAVAERRPRGRAARVRRQLGEAAIRRRVTTGSTRPLPSATARMAVDQHLRLGVLEQEARGPGAQGAEDVLVEVEGGDDDHVDDLGRDSAARPAGGSPRGRRGAACARPSARRRPPGAARGRPPARRPPPRRRSPGPGSDSSSTRNPLRTMAWSSAISTRIIVPTVLAAGSRARPATRRPVPCPASSEPPCCAAAFAHRRAAPWPRPSSVGSRRPSSRMSISTMPSARAAIGDDGVRRAGVLDHVVERLLDDPVRRRPARRRARRVRRPRAGAGLLQLLVVEPGHEVVEVVQARLRLQLRGLAGHADAPDRVARLARAHASPARRSRAAPPPSSPRRARRAGARPAPAARCRLARGRRRHARRERCGRAPARPLPALRRRAARRARRCGRAACAGRRRPPPPARR